MKPTQCLMAFLFTLGQNLFADNINGFAVESNHAFYSYDKTIHRVDVFKKQVKMKKDLSGDTLIVHHLYQVIKKSHNLKEDASAVKIKEGLKNYKINNLTVHNHHVYLGVEFYMDKTTNRKIKYAIIETDTNFNYTNVYYFQLNSTFKYFVLPSQYPLNFLDNQSIALPIYVDTGIFMYRFTLNAKLKKAIPENAISGKIAIVKWSTFDAQSGAILSPLLYPLQGSSNFYFQHPYTYLKSFENKIIDPYNFQLQIDSLNQLRNFDPIIKANFSFDKKTINNFPLNSLLAAHQNHDTVYMITSNSGGLSIHRYNVKTLKGMVKKMALTDQNSGRFIINGNTIVQLSQSGSKHVINTYSISDLLKD